MQSSSTTGQGESKTDRRDVEDVVNYALSHRTRIQILVVLNQGAYAPVEIADIIGESLKNTSHHLKQMAKDGAIEVARTERRRNFEQSFYRAVKLPMYSDEELLKLHPVARQTLIGFVAQSLLAEVLASLYAGKMKEDPHVYAVWDRLELDIEGRAAVARAQERHWDELKLIQEESRVRALLNGETTTPYIVSLLSFERAIEAPVASQSARAD